VPEASLSLIVFVWPALIEYEARPSESWALTLPSLNDFAVSSETEPLQPVVPAGHESFSETTPFLTLAAERSLATPADGDGDTTGRSTASTSPATESAASTVALSAPEPPKMKLGELSRTLNRSLPAPPSAITGMLTPGEVVSVSLPPSSLSSNASAEA